MPEISSGPSVQVQIDVLKKAEDVQEQAVTQLLQDSVAQLKEQDKIREDNERSSGAALTGLGTGLDITA